MPTRFSCSTLFAILLLSSCVNSNSSTGKDNQGSQSEKPELTEKCEAAKQDLNNAVAAGVDNLHELKRNIELYCVWRTY